MPTDITVTISPQNSTNAIISPPNNTSVTVSRLPYAHAESHSPNGSDPITGFASYAQLISVSGLIATVGNAVDLTSDQNVSGVKNFVSRPTVNGVGVLLSGEGAGGSSETGYLTGYVSKFETGIYSSLFYPRNSNPSGYITGVNLSPYQTIAGSTGISGGLQSQISLIQNGTGNFITGIDLSNYATNSFVTGISGYLQNQVGGTGIDYYVSSGSFNTSNGNVTLFRTGDNGQVVFSIDGRYITGQAVRPSETGLFLTVSVGDSRYYPLLSNPSGYLISSDIANLASVSYVTGASGSLQNQISSITSQSGAFITADQTGQFYSSSNPANYATVSYVTGVSGNLVSLISASSAGVGTINGLSGIIAIAGAGNSSISISDSTITVSGDTGFLSNYQPIGAYVDTSQTGQFYPASNPSGYSSTGYVSGVSGYLQGQIINLVGQTGNYALSTNTGSFLTTGAGDSRYYPLSSNPSSYLVAANISNLASIDYVTGVSGNLQGKIDSINNLTGQFYSAYNDVITGLFFSGTNDKTLFLYQRDGGIISGNFADIQGSGSSVSDIVFLTGNQNISGVKNFISRPTVGGINVSLSGEGSSSVDNYTVYVTGNYTASYGERILADTSNTGFTISMPTSLVTGGTVYFADCARTWGVNNLTISGNGARIFRDTGNLICNSSGASIFLTYCNTGVGYNVFYG